MKKRMGAPASSPASGEGPTGTSALPGRQPKLRFPEFDDAWNEVTVGDFFDLGEKAQKAETFEIDKVLTVKLHANGVVKSERTTLTGGANYFKRSAGQFIFSKIDLLNGAFGIIPPALNGFVSSSDVPALSFSAEHSPLFFFNWLKANYWRLSVERTGTSSTLKRVAPTSFLALAISAPSKAEQQKIAECLSTLDELIGAESQKLDALKAHKKGLMQQLFPREGETLPRLRFSEYRDAGAWSKMTFGQAATFYNGRAYKQEELLESGRYPVLRVGNFFTSNTWYYSDLELDETKYCEKGDLLYAWSASFGPKIWLGDRAIYHYHIWKVIEQHGIDKQFLFIALENETENMKAKTTNGLGIMHITKGAIESWESVFPALIEQRKIAGCLTSIDNTITSQIRKIEALKIHKYGLMQQLFPSFDSIQS